MRYRVALALLLLIVGCLLLLNCAPRVVVPHGILGLTLCDDDQPIALINVNAIGTAEERGTIAHEKRHIAQASRFPNCQMWEAWYNSHVAEAEAEAFCADAKAGNEPKSVEIEKYASWLASPVYHLHISTDSARTLINGYCK